MLIYYILKPFNCVEHILLNALALHSHIVNAFTKAAISTSFVNSNLVPERCFLLGWEVNIAMLVSIHLNQSRLIHNEKYCPQLFVLHLSLCEKYYICIP